MAKTVDKDRKAKIAEMQRQAKAADRRRTLTIVGAALVVVALMGGAVTYAIVSDDNRVPGGDLATLGVSTAAASCDPVTTDPAAGGNQHVEGTVKYTTVPPSSGSHNGTPEFPNRGFYTAADRPQMERLVHNLEHGYTVLWYDASASAKQLAALRAVSKQANASTDAKDKFIVSSWDTAYGAFPAGKHFALSHWAADPKDPKKQSGHRELCGDVSGATVQSFIKAYPQTSAPEPGAQ